MKSGVPWSPLCRCCRGEAAPGLEVETVTFRQGKHMNAVLRELFCEGKLIYSLARLIFYAPAYF